MPKRSLLLVDSDARSLRVLEVSLKKAGFVVATATSASGALALALENHPDLVITDTVLPDSDGYELCRRIKSDARLARTGVLFLTADASNEAKVKGINAGADDHLTKPVLVMEIASRVKSLLERKETEAITRRDRPGNLSGALANMGVVDLLQLMESGQKSGIVYLASDAARSGGYVAEGEQRGTIFFRDGRVIDAHLGKLAGPSAVYRMLMWEDGVFEIEFKPLAREDVVHTSTQALLLEGMRRIDEWSRLRDLLPPLETKLAIDFAALASRYKDVPDELRPTLHLFDGRRSIVEVINEAAMDDTSLLQTVAELYRANVLRPPEGGASKISEAPMSAKPTPAGGTSSPDIESWLTGTPRAVSTSELPSVLGRATIPSKDTASEILRAASPLDPTEPAGTTDAPIPLTQPVRERTPMPEPVPEDSLILSRHTVPANKPVLLTQPTAKPMPAAPEPIPLTQPSRAPQRLAIQRVSSVVAARPRAGSQISTGPLQAISAAPELAPPPPAPAPAPQLQSDVWAETARKLQLDETERVIRRPPPAPPVSTEPRSSETGERVPVRSSFIVAATTPPAPAPEQAPARTNGGSHHSSRPSMHALSAQPVSAQAHVTQPIAPLPRRKEESGLNDSFFEKRDEEITWEQPGGRWKSYLLLGAVIFAGAGAFLAASYGGGQKKEMAPLPPSKVAAKKQAGWPATDPSKVEVAAQQPAEIVPVADTQPAQNGQPATAIAQPTQPAQPAQAQTTQLIQPAQPAQPQTTQPAQNAQPTTAPIVKQEPKVETTPPKPAADTAALLATAESALKGDKLMIADKNFRAVLEATPNSAVAHSGLAMVLYSMERDTQAAASAKKALAIDANSARAYLVLGLVASNKQDIATAKKSYSKYLELEPKGAYAAEVRRFMQAQP
jgi:CheY-like chemotaxis protein